MAFITHNGSTFVMISPSVAWIDGLQLASDVEGTIGFTSGSDLVLPQELAVAGSGSFPIRGAFRITAIPNGAGPLTNLPVSIGKTGSGSMDFVATLTNTNSNLTTQLFEVYAERLDLARGCTLSSGSIVVNVNCC